MAEKTDEEHASAVRTTLDAFITACNNAKDQGLLVVVRIHTPENPGQISFGGEVTIHRKVRL